MSCRPRSSSRCPGLKGTFDTSQAISQYRNQGKRSSSTGAGSGS